MPVVLLLLILASPAADSTLQLSPGLSLPQFVASLQHAASRNDRRAVAGMMRYPLEVTAAGLQIPVSDANTFVGLYDSIMTSAMKAVIARARVPADDKPRPDVIRLRGGGIVFENAVTISPVVGGFRVTRLVVPLAASTGATNGTAAAARRLTFRVSRPTQVSGSLDPGGTDRYEFHAAQGAFLDVRLTGVPGRSVLVRILDSKTGKPLDARAGTGTRVWTGRVIASSTYTVEVVRQPDSGTGTLIYTLAVGIK
ncbi:MAG: hypothetical protein AB7Q16_11365 [Vicinamibacterales bacterium]